jgi:hypothetical protein
MISMLKLCPAAALAGLLGLALLAAGSGTASADDRDLLRESSGRPYVFIILDTSGSMNWTPPCSQADFNANKCKTLCPYRDCYARLQADDASSKFYQAKQALYEVLKDVKDVQFGFATYNQDDLYVEAKHWIYLAGSGGVSLPGSGSIPARVFPAVGAEDIIGNLWNCDTGANDHEIGCLNTKPADLDDPWEITRMQRLPKGGLSFSSTVTFYIRWAGTTYKIKYTPTGGNKPGDPTIQLKVRVDKCTNGSCSSTTLLSEPTITYSLSFTNGVADEFLSWDNAGTDPNHTSTSSDPTVDYFSAAASDSGANNTCSGWDPNTDSSNDPGPAHSNTPNVNLRFATIPTDLRGAAFYTGDVIPLDWNNDHKTDILRRLAPNQVLTPAAAPDFRIAPYLANLPAGSDSFLRLKDTTGVTRPLIAAGSTPLGNTINAFKTWYSTGCPSCTPKVTSWKSTAASQDSEWGCRRKYLLVITDGDETCNGDPCGATLNLKNNEGVLTYVVAFGLNVANNSSNSLSCMAKNGGTTAPIYPQNKDELVDALNQIFGSIKEQASSFSSAAVPTVQTEVADKIYISNFTPLNGEPVWDGHIDAYLKPLPLNAAGLPDRSQTCPPVGSTSPPRSACHLWDAGNKLLNQAPWPADYVGVTSWNAAALHLGVAPNTQRRVFYGKALVGDQVPRNMRLFYPPPGNPTTDADWLDLFRGFNLASTTSAERTAAAGSVTDTMKQTLVVKHSTIDVGQNLPQLPVDYVLGDTFHADPTIIDRPADFDRFAEDKKTAACGDDLVTGLPLNGGYKCWAAKHKLRRKMLAVAGDDGQLHFFDAGHLDAAKKFTDGTGNELFAFVPRLAMPIVRDLAANKTHIFGVDSTPRVDEVFIDPVHNGTPTIGTFPSTGDRQWRTVVVGGFREGGRLMNSRTWVGDFVPGYYALDVTQPDVLDSTNSPTTGDLPSCLTLENTAAAPPNGCGPLPFPALLWEFNDTMLGSRLDEDSNGKADLGQTWSIPTIGKIKVKTSATAQDDRFVAIFGGGLDGAAPASPSGGTYLYIVDIETGRLIYKRAVTGAAAADPAVIDANSDGYLDTIYLGTTTGLVYKVNIGTAAQLQNVTIQKSKFLPSLAADQTVQRVIDNAWDPFVIFDTKGKPIYFPPTAVFVSKLDTVALAFGAGDREDLWNSVGNVEGRFYMITDEGFTKGMTGLPFDETKYSQVLPAALATSQDFVINPPAGKNRGWYLRLLANERVITPAFALGGLVVVSSYEPDPPPPPAATGALCGHTGTSRVYTVYASNGNPVLHDTVLNQDVRFQEVDVFVAPPTVDSGSTKNPATGQHSAGELSATQENIMKHLKDYFPTGTKFGNFWFNVSAMGSDTRYVGIAAIPIGIFERNWKSLP